MPRAKGSTKKGQTKSVDGNLVNNVQGQEVGDKLKTDVISLTNGSTNTDELKQKEVTVPKRSGRGKKEDKLVTEEESSKKKPVSKGRTKKKADEVVENKIVSEVENNDAENAAVIKEETVKKSRGKGKKAVTTKKTPAKLAESVENPMAASKEELPKKKGRASKNEKNVESLKSEESEVKEEPLKKKGRATKQAASAEKVEEGRKSQESLEVKPPTSEKKPIKRGRAATKTGTKTEELQENSLNEEVLPKKRSRKAPSVEKEIVEEKPKKSRSKKKADIPEEKVEIQELENAANGEVKLESDEKIKESHNSNKKKPATSTARGGRKRAAPSTNKQKTAVDDDNVDNEDDNELEDEADDSKPSKTKKKTDSAPLNATSTIYNKADFDLAPLAEGQTASDDPRFNFKISSWNVAGLRSWLKKDGLKYLEYEQPDIFCMQETKCTTEQLPEEVVRIPGYHPYWLCMPGGYAGVAVYSKIMPINVEYGIGSKDFDDCGRIITAEYEKFFLVNVYVPNSGRKLVNLDSRMKWEKLFQEFIQNLNARKPVVICGDMNVSHQEHDLANPKTNTRSAGFTKEEREKMTQLLSLGYIDTFRHLYPDRKGAYTFWSYMGNARSRNVGWRLDYFIVSERFIKRVVDNCIRAQCMGSDHCPITLFLKL